MKRSRFSDTQILAILKQGEGGVPAYLENSNPNNHGFYTSHGFEVMGPSISPADAPALIPMWRSQ
jgi:hypothetical protein